MLGQRPRVKASALWGLVGTFSFLVGIQGYALVTGRVVSVVVLGLVGLGVGVAAGVSSYVVDRRLEEANEHS